MDVAIVGGQEQLAKAPGRCEGQWALEDHQVRATVLQGIERPRTGVGLRTRIVCGGVDRVDDWRLRAFVKAGKCEVGERAQFTQEAQFLVDSANGGPVAVVEARVAMDEREPRPT